MNVLIDLKEITSKDVFITIPLLSFVVELDSNTTEFKKKKNA